MTARPIGVITGATRGIGEATAAGLLRAGVDLTLLVRDPVSGAAAVERLERSTGSRARLAVADLADLNALATTVRALIRELPRIDLLLLNAATIPPRRTATKDGLETQFAVNHLAHHLLAREALPALERARAARVVVVASNAHRRGRLDLDDLEAARGYDFRRQYQATKLMNVLFARELAERVRDRGVCVNSLHPGVIGTGLLVDYTPFGRLVAPLVRALAGDPESGARTSLHVALATELEGVTGRYFANRRPATPAPIVEDPVARRMLFERCERYLQGI